MDAYPDQIRPEWKSRGERLTSESFASDPAILTGFVHDHPNLFQAPPTWGSPETPRD
jgi:hypothetical protein